MTLYDKALDLYGALPMDGLVAFYEKYLGGNSNSKAKRVTTIGVAVSLLLLGRALHKLNNPPKHLRHIPYMTFWTTFNNVALRKVSTQEITQKLANPLVQRNKGVFLRPERFGWVVHVATLSAVKTVFMKQDLFPKIDLSTFMEGSYTFELTGTSNILFNDAGEWKKHRKLVAPAFHRSMPCKIFAQAGIEMIEKWETDYPGETFVVDFKDYMNRVTLDIIGLAGFDFEFNAVKDANSPWKVQYERVIADGRIPLYILVPALDKHFRWLLPERREAFKRMKAFLNMLGEIIDHKRAILKEEKAAPSSHEEHDRDLLTLMLESEMRGEGVLTKQELLNDLVIFFVAGHDTTANAMNATIYWLSRHPEIQDKARDEIIRVLYPNGETKEDVIPTIEDTKQMTYLNQVIKESLRISGPVSQLVTPRVCQEDIDLDGTFVPKGSMVAVDMYCLHHDERIWDRPYEFNPDRFELHGEADQNARKGLAWTPFANGTRQCVGMNFSLVEQRVLLALILRRYKFSLPKDSIHKENFITTNHVVMEPLDFNIAITRRF
ncbi:cytochrome P-450 cyp509A1 [Gongronella butleri]|nr:cytochrome P-450 cyp509A1 [Gongronella butleri]